LGQRHIFGIFVIPEAEENRMPQLAVFGQFRVGNLGDEFWGQKCSTRQILDGGAFSFKRLKFAMEQCQVFPIEPRANFSDILQRAAFVGAEEQGAEMFS
jgi:hypothetical protein